MKQMRKKIKILNKLLAFLGIVVMLTGCLSGVVQAGSYEAGKKGTFNLTVQQTDSDGNVTPVSGVKLKLYKVANVNYDGNVHFVLTDSLSSAGLDFESLESASDWYSAAEKLSGMVDSSAASQDAASDAQGKITYSELEEGMYLLVGASDSLFNVTPMLLTIPFADSDNGWIYDVHAYPKAEKVSTKGITIEKRLYYIDQSTFEQTPLVTADATYKVGLFLDKDGTIPYNDDYVKSIHITNAQSGTVTYSNVANGTYYLFELDSNNNPMKLNSEIKADSGDSFYYNVTDTNGTESNSTVVTDTTSSTSSIVYVNNVYYSIPDGFYMRGQITIKKNVVVNGETTTVDDTFYAGVFKDNSGTLELVNKIELKQNGSVTVNVPFPDNQVPDSMTYVVKETDKDGKAVDSSSFAYEVSGEGSVELKKDNQYKGSIELTNSKDTTVTATPAGTPGSSNGGGNTPESHNSSGTSSPVKTGDPMNPVMWTLILLAAILVAAIVVVARKRKNRDK